MKQKGIIYILIVCGLSTLVFGELNGQTSNPFDIIITNADAAKSTIITSPLDSTQANQQHNQTATDTTAQNLNRSTDQTDSIINQLDPNVVIANDRATHVDQQATASDNPFNIQAGAAPKVSIDNNAIKPASPTQGPPKTNKPKPPRKSSKWIPTFKPRPDGNIEQDYSLNFIFWILIASLLILAVVINLKRKSFLNLYRAITNDNYLKLLQREEYNGGSSFFLLLYFLFFLNTALYLYQLITHKFVDHGYRIFLVLCGILLSIYFLRFVSTFLMQLIFPLEKELKQFNFTIIMFNIIVGLLLIPINILIAYAPFGPTIIYSGLIILALFYLLRQLRGLFIAARVKGLSYFHFFIYLCTFEVAPIIWLISIIKN